MKLDSQTIETIKASLAKKQVTLPDGATVPSLGQGTWYIGDDPLKRKQEMMAIQKGLNWV